MQAAYQAAIPKPWRKEKLNPSSPSSILTFLRRSSLFSQRNITGVYIPSVLLIVGVAVFKKEWLPYAAALAAVLGGYRVFASGGEYSLFELRGSSTLTHLQNQHRERSSSRIPSKSFLSSTSKTRPIMLPSTDLVYPNPPTFSVSRSVNTCLWQRRRREQRKRWCDHTLPSPRTKTKAGSSF